MQDSWKDSLLVSTLYAMTCDIRGNKRGNYMNTGCQLFARCMYEGREGRHLAVLFRRDVDRSEEKDVAYY